MGPARGITGQEQTYSENKKLRPKGRDSVNHGLINPLGLYIVYAPFWNLPATFPYCCPTTVLEWEAGHDLVLPPVAIPESIIFHVPALCFNAVQKIATNQYMGLMISKNLAITPKDNVIKEL